MKTIQWNDSTIAAFSAMKEALATAALLSHPKPDTPTSIITNASDVAVGAVSGNLRTGYSKVRESKDWVQQGQGRITCTLYTSIRLVT